MRDGRGVFLAEGSLQHHLLIAAAGIVTATPLVWFAAAARRLAYATIGVMQYITPTLHFLLALLIFGEAFAPVHAVTFAFIWLGVVCFAAGSLLRHSRRVSA